MTHLFEDPDARYLVLVNEAGEYSLWRTFLGVPSGWRVVHEAAGHAAALAYVEENWRDLSLPGARAAQRAAG